MNIKCCVYMYIYLYITATLNKVFTQHFVYCLCNAIYFKIKSIFYYVNSSKISSKTASIPIIYFLRLQTLATNYIITFAERL